MTKIFHIDAFASRPFTGNPAVVCLLTESKTKEWMQSVAAEMNLSETAFVTRQSDAEENRFHLRWFTPTVEVDLCGHATLATSHALWQSGWLAAGETAIFDSRSGELRAEKNGDRIFLNFPATPAEAAKLPSEIFDAMNVKPVFSGFSREDCLIEVETADEVKNVEIDFQRLAEVKIRGVILTAISEDPNFDFISRFFGPAVGVDEDPVTGSAHCCLAPYWSAKLGKPELSAFQASQRGGDLQLRLDGDRVHIGGSAVTIKQGELLI